MRYINCVVVVLVLVLVSSMIAPIAERALADPAPSDPNLVLWMRADQGVTGTSLVTKIDDSSDNDNDMIGAGNPQLVTTTFPTGELPVIRFGGAAAFYVPNSTALNLENASIYMVASQLNGFFTAQCYVSNYGPAFTGYAVGISDSQQHTIKFYTSRGDLQSSLEPFTVPDETPFMLSTTWDSTGSKNAYLDGGPAFHEDGANATYAASNQFVIGGLDPDGTAGTPGQGYHQVIIGDIAEILIYDNVDNAQRTAVESYLRHKYFQAATDIPGDYDHDFDVDAADYVLWRKAPETYGGDPAGYNTWRAHFGETAGSGSNLGNGAVPEPSCCALVVIALLGSPWRYRRHAAAI
jgi:hypothetical protein